MSNDYICRSPGSCINDPETNPEAVPCEECYYHEIINKSKGVYKMEGCLKRKVLPEESTFSSDKPELQPEERATLLRQAVADVKAEGENRFRLDCPDRAQAMLNKVYAGDIEGYREVYRMMSMGIIPQCPRTDEELKCAELLQTAFTYASGKGWYKHGFTPNIKKGESNNAIGV